MVVTLTSLVTKQVAISKYLNSLTTNVVSMFRFIVSFYRYANNRLFYVPSKLTNVIVTKARQVFYMANNIREIATTKFRTIIVNKDLNQ